MALLFSLRQRHWCAWQTQADMINRCMSHILQVSPQSFTASTIYSVTPWFTSPPSPPFPPSSCEVRQCIAAVDTPEELARGQSLIWSSWKNEVLGLGFPSVLQHAALDFMLAVKSWIGAMAKLWSSVRDTGGLTYLPINTKKCYCRLLVLNYLVCLKAG